MPTAESVKAKLQGLIDQANETTGSGDADLTTAVGSLIAGFGQGGGGDAQAVELLYETTFTLDQTYTNDNTAHDIATIEPGFPSGLIQDGDVFFAVIVCTNDTEADDSINHLKARTQTFVVMTGGYANHQTGSGASYSDTLVQYGANFGMYISKVGKLVTTITLAAKSHASWGFAVSGDYSFKLYRFVDDYFGLGGLYD